MSMPNYQIRPLTFGELQMLQQAIVQGAFCSQVALITAQITANKEHDPIVTSLERDLTNLQMAGQAIMNAKPLS